MSQLSGIKDVDREILNKLDDRSLLKACQIDKYTWNKVCDDDFLRRRLLSKYPEIETWRFKGESWKRFFLRAIRYIALLKEEFDYEYTFGHFVTQYNLLKKYKKDIENKNFNFMLLNSAKAGELALVIWFLKNGADIHYADDVAFKFAASNLDVIKYLVENGADINNYGYDVLSSASLRGNLEVVKYLVEKGVDIHDDNDRALRYANHNGHMEVVKYLESKM